MTNHNDENKSGTKDTNSEANKIVPAAPDESTKLIEKPGPKVGFAKRGSVADKLRQAAKAEASYKSQFEVIYLLLDCSGSMATIDDHKDGRRRDQILREAGKALLQEIDFSKNAIAIQSFPTKYINLKPQVQRFLCEDAMNKVCHAGGTPMADALRIAYDYKPLISKAILVSDGEANDDPTKLVRERISANEGTSPFPIDCVHIGGEYGGEGTLKEIAKLTGGIFMKFTDMKKFSDSFKYLAPVYRAMLMSGELDTGANEVKK